MPPCIPITIKGKTHCIPVPVLIRQRFPLPDPDPDPWPGILGVDPALLHQLTALATIEDAVGKLPREQQAAFQDVVSRNYAALARAGAPIQL